MIDLKEAIALLSSMKADIKNDIKDNKTGVAAICCYDGLNERISYLKVCEKDYSPDCYAFLVHEEIASLIKILSEMCEEGDFDADNEIAANEYIKRLNVVLGKVK